MFRRLFLIVSLGVISQASSEESRKLFLLTGFGDLAPADTHYEIYDRSGVLIYRGVGDRLVIAAKQEPERWVSSCRETVCSDKRLVQTTEIDSQNAPQSDHESLWSLTKDRLDVREARKKQPPGFKFVTLLQIPGPVFDCNPDTAWLGEPFSIAMPGVSTVTLERWQLQQFNNGSWLWYAKDTEGKARLHFSGEDCSAKHFGALSLGNRHYWIKPLPSGKMALYRYLAR